MFHFVPSDFPVLHTYTILPTDHTPQANVQRSAAQSHLMQTSFKVVTNSNHAWR
jgi:hypothetical protein